MPADWRSAYFAQAQSDYRTLLLLNQAGADFRQRLHYLQMTTEKRQMRKTLDFIAVCFRMI